MNLRILAVCALSLGFIARAGADTTPPCAPATVYLSTGKSTACLYWFNSDAGDDCVSGSPSGLPTMWEIRMSTSVINSSNWQSAPVACRFPCIGSTDQGFSFEGLSCNTTHYFALFFFDEVGNRSPGVFVNQSTLGCSNNLEVACDNDAPCEDVIAPSPSPYLNSSGGCENIYLWWYATGDDITIGTATSYDLRWSSSPITTDAAFNAASAVPGTLPTPGAPGTQETFAVYVGNCGPQKYFALKIVDEVGNKSTLTSDPYGASPACVQWPEMCWESRTPGGEIELSRRPARAEDKPLPFLTGTDLASRSIGVNFSLTRAEASATLDLSIYNIAGQRVATLRNSNPGEGRHTVRWDLRDETGHEVKAGIYFVRLRVAAKMTTQRVVVVP